VAAKEEFMNLIITMACTLRCHFEWAALYYQNLVRRHTTASGVGI
jgi:hypothetical protein